MRLIVRILGLELLSIEANIDEGEGEQPFRGDVTTTPIGFAPDTHGHDWQRGVER